MIKRILLLLGAGSAAAFGFSPQTYIQNTATLQLNAGFNVSSGNVAGVFKSSDVVTKGPWTDIRSFGAVADGITDNASAINAAIAVSSNVYIPCGTFLIGSPILVTARTNFQMMGAGPCAQIYQKNNTPQVDLDISSGTDSLFMNFAIYGNYKNQAGDGSSHGFRCLTCNRVKADHLLIKEVDGPAVRFGDLSGLANTYGDALTNSTLDQRGPINGSGIKINSIQHNVLIDGNDIHTDGQLEAMQVELSSSVISNNVAIATASIGITLNGGDTTSGWNGENRVIGNHIVGNDIGLEIGNADGLTTIIGNTIEQIISGTANAGAIEFTGSGPFVSSNVVIADNVIIASATLVQLGNGYTIFTGNFFMRSNLKSGLPWFVGIPYTTSFIGNYFDGENTSANYTIFSNNMANTTLMGNVFNCGLASTATAISPQAVNNPPSVFFGNRFLNCTNTFVSGGFDYQIGDQVRAVIGAGANFVATGQWGDATTISLTPGVWQIAATVTASTAPVASTGFSVAISSVNGNFNTNLVDGDNQADVAFSTSTSTTQSISNFVIKETALTPYYLKIRAFYTGSTPAITNGRINAIRLQ